MLKKNYLTNRSSVLKKPRAFSLTELSVVMVIIAILITTSLSSSLTGSNNARIVNTNARISEIYKALGNYVAANGRLPCPASLKKVKGVDSDYGAEVSCSSISADNGIYQSSSQANLIFGALPVKTLGLSNEMAEDGFESKFVYVVNKDTTIASNFGIETSDNIIIRESSRTVESAAMFAIISHGANKAGAYASRSSTQNAIPTETNEIDNYIKTPTSGGATAADNIFYLSSANDDFDDIIFFRTRNFLTVDFRLYALITCAGYVDTTNTASTASVTWPTVAGNSIAVSATECPTGVTGGFASPSKRCEPFGTWGDIIKSCLTNN